MPTSQSNGSGTRRFCAAGAVGITSSVFSASKRTPNERHAVRHEDCKHAGMRKLTQCLLVLALAASSVSTSGLASAQETVGARVTPGSAVSIFGTKSQIAISSEAGAVFTTTSVSGVDDSSTTFVLRPGVDYFLINRLSLGAFFGVQSQSQAGGSSTTFGIGPRVGYDIPFSDRFSIWPRVGFSYNATTVKVDAQNVGGINIPGSSTSNNAMALNVFAPFLFHTNHYFAGLGPALDTDLSGDAKATTFALRVTLGGWLF